MSLKQIVFTIYTALDCDQYQMQVSDVKMTSYQKNMTTVDRPNTDGP